MPFTLVHRKDGKEVPIQMSIWDAFRGVPDPRPRRPKPAHVRKNNDKAPNKNQNTANTGAKVEWKKGNTADTATGGGSNSYSTSDLETWTPAEDAKLVEMKKNNATWNNIVAELGKSSKSQVHQRYRELTQHAPKDDEGKNAQDEKKTTGEQKKAENLANQDNDGKGGKKKKGKGKGDDDNDNKGDNKKTSSNKVKDDIKAWADKYEEMKWTAVAAKHYDKTAERLSPEELKRMAEKK